MTRGLLIGGLVAGLAGLGLAVLAAEDWHAFLRAYLTGYAYFLSIALGALFFVIVQHLTRSGWSVAVRRIAEGLATGVTPLALLFIPVIAGLTTLYHWTHPGDDALLLGKSAYLNPEMFVIRVAAYFGIWILMARFYLRNSVRQDETGDVELTRKMERRSPIAIILYGVTVTFASFDLLMSLDPHWYSTIFGVYYFSGALVGFFAALILVTFFAQRAGHLVKPVTTEHYHDLGKQLFGYTVFWAYIAFSQYMLIWYANIPEETVWFLARQTGGWGVVSLILLFGHFVVPFLVMLPREVKRRPAALAAVAGFMLIMHWVDIFWLVAPEKGSGHVPFGIEDVGCFIGLGGLFAAAIAFTLRKVSLVPEKDPRLAESLAFENV